LLALIKKENMKKVVLVILACCGIGMTMNALALEDYVGFSLDAVKSSENGENNSSAGFTVMISARPNEYYGSEVQGGIFGETGKYSVSCEMDYSMAVYLPLGSSGINLYGKAGADGIYSSGNVSSTGWTYGAGVEYQHGKGIVRLGFQHFDLGKNPSLSTKLVGVTFMFKLDK
jgi:opacity protein-like surface antigen